MKTKVAAGIDIGGTKIALALETLGGEKTASRRIPTRVEIGSQAIVENIAQTLAEMAEASQTEIVSVGIGCPSPLDIEKGLVMSPSNLRDWDRFPIVRFFEEYFNVPVVLDNDANAAALGEFVYGAGRGYKNVVYITVSTGIGGGIIINGEIFHGVAASAGELGHTIVQPDGGARCNCGSTGCLETVCSGVHIARRAKEKLAGGAASLMSEIAGNTNELTAETVVEAVRRGDELAIEIWDETCRYLAIGIGNIISLLAPEAVIVGGGVAAAGKLLFAPLKSLVPQFVSMVPADEINIVPAELGAQSGVCGALVLAKKAYSQNYQTYAV